MSFTDEKKPVQDVRPWTGFLDLPGTEETQEEKMLLIDNDISFIIRLTIYRYKKPKEGDKFMFHHPYHMNPFHPWMRHDPMGNGFFGQRMRFFHGPGHGGPFGPKNPFRAMRSGKRFFKRGGIKFALLELLLEGPMHGYEMMKKLEEKTEGFYVPSPGSIYPTLQLLEDQGYVSVEEREGKKLYCITDAGRSYLKENQKEQSSFISSEFEPFVQHQAVQQIHLEAAELSRLLMFVTHQVLRRSNDEENEELLHFLKKTRNELLALLQQQDQQPED